MGIRSGTPEPEYQVITSFNQIEIRQYSPRLAASTSVGGDEISARSTGFRRLAAYIFGGNTSASSIAMTAPVAQSSSKIAMTAPVVQQRNAAGEWVIQFFMPAAYTLQTLPKPKDPDVHIIEVPAEVFAVYRFSGARNAAAETAAQTILLAALQGKDWQPQGPVIAWFYDPPWTLPWFRRNEVAIAVTPKINGHKE